MKEKYKQLFLISIIRGIIGPVLNGLNGLFITAAMKDLDIGVLNQTIFLSLISLFCAVGLNFFYIIEEKLGIKKLMLLSGNMQCLAFLFLGFFNNIVLFYLVTPFLGFGVGCIVNLYSTVLVGENFQNNKGKFIGVMLFIASLVGGIGGYIAGVMIKNSGYKMAYIFLGGASLLIFNIAMHFITIETKKRRKREKDNKINLKIGIIFILVLSFTAFNSFFLHIPIFLQKEGYENFTTSKLLSLSFLGTSFGALIMGKLSDKLSAKKAVYISCIISISSMLIFLFLSSNNIFVSIACFLFGVSVSSLGVIPPLIVKEVIKKENYAKTLSKVTLANPLGSIVFLLLYGYLFEIKDNYTGVIYIIIAFMLFSIISITFLKKDKIKNA